MKKLLLSFVLILIFESNALFASFQNSDNYLLYPITEERFISIIEEITDLYKEIFNEHKEKLVISHDWDDDKFNANAMSMWGEKHVHFAGGIARSTGIDPGALAFVICHEIGHHLGGLPLKRPSDGQIRYMEASAEGQADYFATSKCLKKYFKKKIIEDREFFSSRVFDYEIYEQCLQVYTNEDDLLVCQMSIDAGYRFAKSRHAKYQFYLPDSEDGQIPFLKLGNGDVKVVEQTYRTQANVQCRLDTLVAGALCDKSEDDLPNYYFKTNLQGNCTRSEGYVFGLRPACWYNPEDDLLEGKE